MMVTEMISVIAFAKIHAQVSDLQQRVVSELPRLNIKFYVIGLTSQSSLYPNKEISTIITKAIANSVKPHHRIVQLPRYPYVASQLSQKVTRRNVDETGISGNAFNLVTSFFNIAKD